MITGIDTNIREATLQDRQRLASLIHFEQHVHRHLDWRSPLDWLGYQPYVVLERAGQLVAALSCPPDPPGVAWIRMFASADTLAASYAWQLLWPAARSHLRTMACTHIAAIPMQPWFRNILEKDGFTSTHKVVLLVWEGATAFAQNPALPATLRPMDASDLAAVHEVDGEAFRDVWRISLTSLELAFHQSSVAAVAEDELGIVGYQISTHSPVGGHLARLAVHPRVQRRGIGLALVQDALQKFEQQGVGRVTVNTQQDNIPSLALYQRTGFRVTGEMYPVYQSNLS